MNDFEHFRTQRAVALGTYRRDGSLVLTPVSIAVDATGSNAFVRTWTTAGKAKRLRHSNRVTVAPCTAARGRITGPAAPATARPLHSQEIAAARRLLRHKHPLLHGILVPLAHRVRRLTTCYYELTTVVDVTDATSGSANSK